MKCRHCGAEISTLQAEHLCDECSLLVFKIMILEETLEDIRQQLQERRNQCNAASVPPSWTEAMKT